LAICFVNFAFLVLDHGGLPTMGLLPFGTPATLSELLRWGAIGSGLGSAEPWRFLSAVFLHLSPLHLLMNASSAIWLCKVAEKRVGGARMIIVFVVTGALGFVASDLWKSYGPFPEPYITAGASGALFGLMGHEIGHMHMGKDPNTRDVLVRFAVSAVALALIFPVNNAAHFGGFAVGYPLSRLMALDKRPWRLQVLYQGLAVLCIAASVASIVLCVRSRVWMQYRAIEVLHGRR
jgi:rhomboid protease GluP